MPLRIAQLGQPILRQIADPVVLSEIATSEFQSLLDAMIDTLFAARGIGLAAPQVFVKKRLFVACVLPGKEDPRAALEIFINPQLRNLSDERHWEWEGCLSFIELLVHTPRHESVHIEYFNRQGQPQALDLAGYPGRVVQHEYDHLEGILTIDRATSTRDIIKASEIDAVAPRQRSS
jgi:peptide deformylase